jgi:hypothetical protein
MGTPTAATDSSQVRNDTFPIPDSRHFSMAAESHDDEDLLCHGIPRTPQGVSYHWPL